MKTPLFPLALLFALPATSFAWSAHGHQAVGAMAQKLLSPDSQRAVAAILGPGVTLDQIAACADSIRNQRGFSCAGIWLDAEPQSSHWHYINTPVTASPRSPSDLAAYCPDHGCVVDQIRAAVDTLKSSAKGTDKQVALMFLVHFVGDEHQPLHSATGMYNGSDDRGGNLEPVVWGPGIANFGSLNLHSVWDHVIEKTDAFDPQTLASELLRTLPGDSSSWTSGDYVGQAALESFQIAKDQIYPAYSASSRIDDAYHARFQPIAKRQLQKAGVRLAALIESAVSQQTTTLALASHIDAKAVSENLRAPAFQ